MSNHVRVALTNAAEAKAIATVDMVRAATHRFGNRVERGRHLTLGEMEAFMKEVEREIANYRQAKAELDAAMPSSVVQTPGGLI